MSLSRLYRLNEAPEKMISRQEVDRRWPEALPYLDRDFPESTAVTFFVDRQGNLLANTKGHGWRQFYPEPNIFGTSKDGPSWGRISKLGVLRGGSGRFKDPEFKGNPGSHQDFRQKAASQNDEQQMPLAEDEVARRFGQRCLKLAMQIEPNPDDRSFVVSGVHSTNASGFRANFSKTAHLTMETLGPEDGTGSRMVAQIWDWDGGRWRGPY